MRKLSAKMMVLAVLGLAMLPMSTPVTANGNHSQTSTYNHSHTYAYLNYPGCALACIKPE